MSGANDNANLPARPQASPDPGEKPSAGASQRTDPLGTDEIASDVGAKDEIPGFGPRSPEQRRPVPPAGPSDASDN